MVVKKWHEAHRRFYLYRPKRVLEKALMKDNWLNLPQTLAHYKRFFLGNKNEVPQEKLNQAKVAA
ncbi:MAG: hypothetical protein DCC55_29395 [Chloroflexi bacterium]|nr:MAG: hypothetical protein DCC55_29395 [Chloroflexota bacterium]